MTLGTSDYVVKSRPSFRAVYFRLRRLVAHAALLDERSRPPDNSTITADVEREAADREDLVRRLAEAESARESAEQGLTEAVIRIKQARQDRLADAVAAAREYAQHEADFAARLRAAAAANG